jgi:uncharacterized membrane protein YdbT with pleckstrin-like domain
MIQPETSAYVRKLLGNDEKVVFMTRKHIIVIARALLFGVVAVIVIGAGAIFVGSLTGGVGYVLLVLLLLPLWQLAVIISRWRNEEYLVTNRRVMKIEGVVSKHVFDSSLEKVNDVELDQSGFGRMFNYGDVDILTGNVGGANKFLTIAFPVEFKRQMLDQKEALGTLSDFGTREKQVLQANTPAKADVPQLIAELDELRKKGIINQADFEAKKADLLKRM